MSAYDSAELRPCMCYSADDKAGVKVCTTKNWYVPMFHAWSSVAIMIICNDDHRMTQCLSCAYLLKELICAVMMILIKLILLKKINSKHCCFNCRRAGARIN